MENENVVRDLQSAIPTCCRDILKLAEEALERYWSDPSVLNLFSMALLTNHVADWYIHTDLGLKPPRSRLSAFLEEFGEAYPAWDAIRSAGNGLKHSRVQLVTADNFFTEEMMWEHPNAWTGEAYGVPYAGKMMPVDRLCFEFVRDFSADLTTGRVRERLPKLHAND